MCRPTWRHWSAYLSKPFSLVFLPNGLFALVRRLFVVGFRVQGLNFTPEDFDDRSKALEQSKTLRNKLQRMRRLLGKLLDGVVQGDHLAREIVDLLEGMLQRKLLRGLRWLTQVVLSVAQRLEFQVNNL